MGSRARRSASTLPSMALRLLRLVLLAALNAGPLTTLGCSGSGPAMSKAPAPAGGISLSYNFTPGQTFTGSVDQRSTIQFTGGSMSITSSLKFGVKLVVRGKDPERGGNLIEAKLSGVEISLATPSMNPQGTSDIMNAARKALKLSV